MPDAWIGGGFGFPPRRTRPRDSDVAPGVEISVDGWTASRDAVEPRGDGWTARITKFKGWDGGGVTIRRDTTDSPTGDGVVQGPPALGARTITVSGLIYTDFQGRDGVEIREAGDVLASVLSAGVRTAPFVVAERMRGLTREADVQLVNTTPDFEILTPWMASWSLFLTAADPLRYESGETIIRPGQTIRVPNRGRIISRPLVDFVGPLTAPSLSGFDLGADVPAGVTLTADMRQRIVWRNGVRTFTPARGFWQNVPVGGIDYTLSGSGTGYARVRRSSAWP